MGTLSVKRGSAVAGLLCTIGAFLCGTASAADLPTLPPAPTPVFLASAPHPFFVRAGVSAVSTSTDITSTITVPPPFGTGVTPVAGNGQINTVPAAYFEAGYYVTRNIAASISGGFPPTFTTQGLGALAPQGVLYRAVVGLPVFAVTYHLDNFGPVRPYAGLGVGYSIVFRNEAAAILSPLLRNKAAFVIVGGVDYDITEHWGVFVDVKKAFLTQQFTGIAQVPIPPFGVFRFPTAATVRTDPLIATLGISYRF